VKVIVIPTRARTLNRLLKKARRQNVILESSNGEQFVLARITNMEGFAVGADANFENEAKMTRQNKRLMEFLDARVAKTKGQKGIPIAEVRRRLASA
jgi:hypothetical protein